MTTFFLLFVFFLAAYFLVAGIITVPKDYVVVVYRLGRFHKILRPGFNIIMPFIDKPREISLDRSGNSKSSIYVYMGENSISIPPANPFRMKDGAEVVASMVLSFRIIDIVAVAYSGVNIPERAEKASVEYMQRAFSLISDIDAIDRFYVNAKAVEALNWQLKSIGVEVTGFELLKVIPAREFMDSIGAKYFLSGMYLR